MNILSKIINFIAAIFAVPLYFLEKREKERKLNERLKRLQDKYKENRLPS